MPKEKRYWQGIKSKNCLSEIRMKSTNNFVSVLGDTPPSVCIDQGEDPFAKFALLVAQFVSTRISSLFGVISTLFENGTTEKKTRLCIWTSLSDCSLNWNKRNLMLFQRSLKSLRYSLVFDITLRWKVPLPHFGLVT